MQVHYLEIVTPDVEDTCSALQQVHGVPFGEPVATLGNARTADLPGGGRLGSGFALSGGQSSPPDSAAVFGESALGARVRRESVRE